MSIQTSRTFEDDGYADGRAGRRPNPPDPKDGVEVYRREYLAGYDAGNHDYSVEQASGPHGQG